MMRSAITAPMARSVVFQIPARTVPISSYSTFMYTATVAEATTKTAAMTYLTAGGRRG
jgi:hypothetical protein